MRLESVDSHRSIYESSYQNSGPFNMTLKKLTFDKTIGEYDDGFVLRIPEIGQT